MAILKNTLVAVTGLLVGVVLLGGLAPPPDDPWYAAADALRPDCEVMFIGPSYVNSQVFPDVVDAEAREHNVEFKSCKLSRTAMKGYEIKRELSLVLSKSWPKLKLVVIDVTLGADNRFSEKNDYTSRILRWHTWDFGPWYLNHIWGERFKGNPKFDLVRRLVRHSSHLVVNQLHVGHGAERLAALHDVPERVPWGYKPPTTKKEKQKRKRLNKKRVRTLLERRELPQEPGEQADRGRWFRELRDEVRLHHVEADALIAPVWRSNYVSPGFFPEADPPVVHAFNDPATYPRLYRHDAHTGSEHLSPLGSHQYSLLLGQALAQRMKQLQ